MVHAKIELSNSCDRSMLNSDYFDEKDIKKFEATAIVDLDAKRLTINEVIQEYLQLSILDKQKIQLLNGDLIECNIVGPIDIRFENRKTTCRAIVLPGNSKVILGTIPLMDMDVLIDPIRKELIIHPLRSDMAQVKI